MTLVIERQQRIKNYQETDSSFEDYTKFEGQKRDRLAAKAAFISGADYQPHYDYPKLDDIAYDEKIRDKKSAIYKAVLELEVAKTEPGANLSELEVFAAYHELRLKKIMLVEAARDINTARTSAEQETAANSFMALNREVYGEYDVPAFQGMIATERNRALNFTPHGDAEQIKQDLLSYLDPIDTNHEHEKSLMSPETLQKLHDVVMKRYEHIFAAVPDTGDEVYYNAEQSASIMNLALASSGLAEKGWKTVVNAAKSNPATAAKARLISLPLTTRRNASELRRLIVHEQEVHGRRGENGRETGFGPLAGGTADYADVEEGLGVLLECAVDNNLDSAAFHRARDRYITAGLALGADGKPRDARRVYEILWRMIAIRGATDDGTISESTLASARDQAYGHIDNAFRGTAFWMRGVIYIKLKVYYEGLRKNADLFTEHVDDLNQALDLAMVGKYNHTDPVETENIMDILQTRADKD